jgi:Mor family transcriptional regulator
VVGLDKINKVDSNELNGIYKEFAEVLGFEVTQLIFKYFKGLQVTFPTKLLSKNYVEKKVVEEYNGSNMKELAREYNYSERWVRQVIKVDRERRRTNDDPR